MSSASRGAGRLRWTVRREKLGGCLRSARAGPRSAPREVTSQSDAFVYHVTRLTQRARGVSGYSALWESRPFGK
eukprot:950565-Prymnesium_polylepis.1